MSKSPRPTPEEPQQPWDARGAYHRATLAVYEDLGALINALKLEPDRRVALLHLDELIHRHEAPAPGESDLVAALKTAVGRLRASLATARDIQDKSFGVGSAFWRGSGVDRTWGAISSGSHHNVLFFAASAMLEPDSEGFASIGGTGNKPHGSGIIRRRVIEAAMDPNSWRQLGDELRREFDLASLMPPREIGAARLGPIARWCAARDAWAKADHWCPLPQMSWLAAETEALLPLMRDREDQLLAHELIDVLRQGENDVHHAANFGAFDRSRAEGLVRRLAPVVALLPRRMPAPPHLTDNAERVVLGGASEKQGSAAVPQAHDTLGGHWVPASTLVDKHSPRFKTVAKITSFCSTHGIPSRPGLTKAGKPWARRRDVHLESWQTKVAALDIEGERLKDAADRMTADAKQFGKWSTEDQVK